MTEEDIHPLQLTSTEVARLTGSQRTQRVHDLMERSHEIVGLGEEKHLDGRLLTGRVILYSGGDDSTTLVHLLREMSDAAAHANTGIGIEETRQFVRDTCATWQLRLLEKHPPVSYRDLVLEQGFPGPAQHFKMYQRLKERCLRQVRADFVVNPRHERVVFFAGRRRDESTRRADVPMHEREGSTIWISPLIEWTKLDLNTYRLMMGDVPRNLVSATLHMSGECLCGSFARQYELQEIAIWYPQDAAEILDLEAQLVGREDIPLERRTWGWGAWRNIDPEQLATYRARLGPMCSACAR